MNFLMDGMKNILEKFNCCKMNHRTASHHNLSTEEFENLKEIPLEHLASNDSDKETNDRNGRTTITIKTPTIKSPWSENKIHRNLWEACENNDLETVKKILDDYNLEDSRVYEKNYMNHDGIDSLELNAHSPEGSTLLHNAVKKHNIKLVELLLEYTPSININCLDIYRRTPLHIACIENDFIIAKLFIDKGVLLNAIDSEGNTALHYAIVVENIQIIEFLVCMCANLEIKNHQGITAIDFLKQKNININLEPSEILTISEYDEVEGNILVTNEIVRPDKIVTLKDFEPVQIIGRGSFGEVFLAKMKNSEELYAMKILKKEKIFAQNLIRYVMTERNVLSYINHPFIVRLRYAFQDVDKVFLILDYCPGGNLTACINRYQSLPEDIARIYMCEILLALSELHQRGIIYRDLKPDNVILDIDGHLLLTDFGLSKEGVLDNVSAMSFCGSIAYLAPEMIRRQGHGKAVDWYLFGVILYEMLTGKPPYYNSDRKILLYNIENVKLKIPPRLSDEAKDLLKRLLKRDPNKRLGSVGDSDEVKQHPFFAGINWIDVYNKKLKPPVPPPSLIKSDFLSGYKLGSDEHSNIDTKLNGWTFVSE
ncbi:hypothetical protein SteCoe_23172 [Stentor coeruleus]|uniref:non-specific serine/threonine protein kinase n=1 Tax=Stentor coeruleus TaxID=5963 RepID=A0A1R2BKF9_9CILI|nr:hypothetical protein SteCoe_23172 [Stentor coeruleus]